MNALNNVLIEGNLVRDPDSINVSDEKTVCKFSIAVNQQYKKNEEIMKSVSYFDVQVWQNLAESCQKYLRKGNSVRVSGRLKQDRWEDEDGKKYSRVLIVGEHVDFQGGRKKSKTEKEESASEAE